MFPAPQGTSNRIQPQCGGQNAAPPPERSASQCLEPVNVNVSVSPYMAKRVYLQVGLHQGPWTRLLSWMIGVGPRSSQGTLKVEEELEERTRAGGVTRTQATSASCETEEEAYEPRNAGGF